MRLSLSSALLSFLLAVPVVARAQAAAGSVDSAGAAVAGDAVVRSEEAIHVAALRYAPAVRGCYEREGLRRDPTLDGTITIAMTVLPDGRVREVTVDTAAVRGSGMREVVQCVAAAAATWRFDQGAYAIERAELPFHCAPATTTEGGGELMKGSAAGESRTP
jgi:hypothetical protein